MITARDLLLEAKHLLALPQSTRTETRRRTIISRSYYAAYHHLQAHEIGERYRRSGTEKTGMHRAFLNYLGSIRDPDVNYAHRILNDLYEWRVRADYWLRYTVPVGTDQQCWEDAETLMLEILPA